VDACTFGRVIRAVILDARTTDFTQTTLEVAMGWLITKYLLTAAVVVLVSEAAKRSDKFGGFIAALPLVTFLTLIWLYAEKQPEAKIANHAWYTFWYVVPTFPMCSPSRCYCLA
jgi:hypothetical protein